MSIANKYIVQASTVALSFFCALVSASERMVLEEVIVTAQKKAESLTKAPLTVNLISEDALKNAAIFDAQELSKLTAGIDIRNEGNNNTGVGIRGVGTFAQVTAPPRVSTYMDDYYLGSQESFAFSSLFDMKQIQILRGPQGTLYGQPSPTGALLLETADPDLEEVGGYVRASYLADPNGYNVQGALSVPLIDNVLGARVAFLTDDSESGVENITRGFDDERSREGARVKLLWQPSEDFSAKLGYSYLRFKDSGAARILESIDPTSDFQLEAGDRIALADTPEETIDRKNWLLTLHLDWELDWGSIRWFSGDLGSDTERVNDADHTQYTAGTEKLRSVFDESVQHELRISVDPTEWWNAQFGGYYSSSSAASDVQSLSTVVDVGVFEVTLDIPSASETKAIFSHNSFQFNELTSLIVGVRYNEFDADNASIINGDFYLGSDLMSDGTITEPSAVFTGVLPCPDPALGPPCESLGNATDKEWTGTLKLVHSYSDALNMYATLDHGFRPGSVNYDVTGSYQPTPEDPDSGVSFYTGETVDSFEIGAKGDIWGGRGQYTSAVFYSVYEDYQVRPVFEAWNGADGGVSSISGAEVNVDEAVQVGIEGELRVLATEDLELFGSFTYAQVEFTDGVVPCTDPTQEPLSPSNRYNTCDADGEAASPQPEWFVNLMASYTRPTPVFGGAEWYVNGLVNYRSEIEVPGDSIGRFATDGYTTVDLLTGIRADSWDVQLFMKNAFDDDAILRRGDSDSANELAASTGGVALYNDLSVIRPRTVGVTVGFYF
ncbi:MAG: TonB-dependent receptor plug domain-containing protein [Halioglobus sp.]